MIVHFIGVWLFWGSCLVVSSSYIKLIRAIYRQRIYIIGKIVRHVALLVTEISWHKQNFMINPPSLGYKTEFYKLSEIVIAFFLRINMSPSNRLLLLNLVKTNEKKSKSV